MKIGYARVSTDDQNLDLQRAALESEGCGEIFEDKASGSTLKRPGLSAAIDRAGPGDTLTVWKLDRLGRSLLDLVGLATELNGRNIGLKVLTGAGAAIDTTKADGRMMFGLLAVMAEFEREMIRERTTAGIAAAKRRGVRVGRPPKLEPFQLDHARRLIDTGETTRAGAAALFGVDVKTLWRALNR